jgi:hypothetical protein
MGLTGRVDPTVAAELEQDMQLGESPLFDDRQE